MLYISNGIVNASISPITFYPHEVSNTHYCGTYGLEGGTATQTLHIPTSVFQEVPQEHFTTTPPFPPRVRPWTGCLRPRARAGAHAS